MDSKTCELFSAHKILLKNLKRVPIDEICKKRTLEIYFGVRLDGFYELVFIRRAKSRLLKKEADELAHIAALCEAKFDTAIKKRILFYSSEICSKSLKYLNENGWKCHDFV